MTGLGSVHVPIFIKRLLHVLEHVGSLFILFYAKQFGPPFRILVVMELFSFFLTPLTFFMDDLNFKGFSHLLADSFVNFQKPLFH